MFNKIIKNHADTIGAVRGIPTNIISNRDTKSRDILQTFRKICIYPLKK